MIFDYQTQSYFNPTTKITGFLLLIIGIPSLFMNWIFAIILILIGLFIVSATYGLSIDLQKMKYKDYLQMYWIKTGQEQSFVMIEKLFITSGTRTTKMQVRAHATYLNEKEFNGYIKFSDGEKVHLICDLKKKKVEQLLKTMANDLSVNVEDLSKE